MNRPEAKPIPASLTTQHPSLPLSVLYDLQDAISASAKIEPRLEAKLRALVRAHPLLNLTWQTGHTFWRGRHRSVSERHGTLKEMLWRPAAAASLGRGNLAGESVLYLGDHVPTIIAELSAGKPASMQFIALEIRPGMTMRFLPVGEIAAIGNSGQSVLGKSSENTRLISDTLSACPADEVERLILADQLLFDAFAAPGRHDLASVIANEMRLKIPEVDGVMYASTKRKNSTNVAMRPSSALAKCRIVSALTADVCEMSGSGECRIERIEAAEGVDARGVFSWSGRVQSHIQIAAFDPPANLSDYQLDDANS